MNCGVFFCKLNPTLKKNQFPENYESVTEAKLTLLTTWQASKSGKEMLKQGIGSVFGKPADQKDGRLVSQKNHLMGFWMPVYFIEHREGGGEEVK